MDLYRATSQTNFYVPISEVSNQDDDYVSQITQTDEEINEDSRSPAQSKMEREMLAREMHRLQTEAHTLERKIGQNEKERLQLVDKLKVEANLTQKLQMLRADVRRLKKEATLVTARGLKLKSKAKSIEAEIEVLAEECDRFESQLQRNQAENLNSVCSLHNQMARDLLLLLPIDGVNDTLSNKKLRTCDALQDEIRNIQKKTISYEDLYKRTCETIDQLDDVSRSSLTERVQSAEHKTQILEFVRTSNGIFIEELEILRHSMERFGRIRFKSCDSNIISVVVPRISQHNRSKRPRNS